MEPQLIVDIFRRNITEHYFDMNGRVSRLEFWYFVLAFVVVLFVTYLVGGILHLYLLGPLVHLALLPPLAGLGARRLQDTGQNGSLVWLAIAPAALNAFISLMAAATGPFGALGFLVFFFSIGWLISLAALAGALYIAYLCAQPGQSGENAFGPEPAAPPKPVPAA